MNVQQKLPIVLSSVALGVAILGATPAGQAAARLVVPSNSVGTLQLKTGSVTEAKIRKHSLSSAVFKAGALPTSTGTAQAIPGPQGAQGAQGPQGVAGQQGPKGDTGPAGITGYHIVVASSGTVAPGAKGLGIAMCAQGEKALGGGFGSNTANATWTVDNSYPADSNPRFIVMAHNASPFPAEFIAMAVCATVAS